MIQKYAQIKPEIACGFLHSLKKPQPGIGTEGIKQVFLLRLLKNVQSRKLNVGNPSHPGMPVRINY
jgi:hypothetical protein